LTHLRDFSIVIFYRMKWSLEGDYNFVTKWVCLNLCKLDSSFATRRPLSSTVACFQELDLRFGHFGHLCSSQWRHPAVLLWTCQWSDHLKLHDLRNCWMGYFLAGSKVPKHSYKVINYFNNSRTINIKICTIVKQNLLCLVAHCIIRSSNVSQVHNTNKQTWARCFIG